MVLDSEGPSVPAPAPFRCADGWGETAGEGEDEDSKEMLANKLSLAEQELEEATSALEAKSKLLESVLQELGQDQEGAEQLEGLLGASFAALAVGGLDFANVGPDGSGRDGEGNGPGGVNSKVNVAMANELAGAKRQVQALQAAMDRQQQSRDSALGARVEELEGRTEELEVALAEKSDQLAALGGGVAGSAGVQAVRVSASDYFHQVSRRWL